MVSLSVGFACRPIAGERLCGDAGEHWRSDRHLLLAIADGLGHGPEAAQAADAAIRYVAAHTNAALPALMAGCDRALHGTRGVALGLARIDTHSGDLEYAAIGNTRCLLLRRRGAAASLLGASPGIAGGGFKHVSVERETLSAGHWLVLCTDGIREELDRGEAPERLGRDAQTLARHLLDAWARQTDDAAVLVCLREEAP